MGMWLAYRTQPKLARGPETTGLRAVSRMMQGNLEIYESIVGASAIQELRELAGRLKGRRIRMINSTAVGGGVAEILQRLVPLMNELGLDAHWDVIDGADAFFHATKQFHYALQGGRFEHIGPRELAAWLETNRSNAARLIDGEDFVAIHDPQPLALVEARTRSSCWIWRCHIDLSAPDAALWRVLRPYVERYDAAVFSSPAFRQELAIPQHIFFPSIDPLADKNRELPDATVDRLLERLAIPRDKPIVIQVSRFDPLKDPLGVIEAFRLARRRVDCRLVLVGGAADDDPEGEAVLAGVLEAASGDPDIHVLGGRQFDELEINALVRGATIVLQKSLKEGFGLTVSEALWKRKPVIATPAGGLPEQVIDGVTGKLVSSPQQAADRICELLADPRLMQQFGEAGREHVRRNFLVTGCLRRWLVVMERLAHARPRTSHPVTGARSGA